MIVVAGTASLTDGVWPMMMVLFVGVFCFRALSWLARIKRIFGSSCSTCQAVDFSMELSQECRFFVILLVVFMFSFVFVLLLCCC